MNDLELDLERAVYFNSLMIRDELLASMSKEIREKLMFRSQLLTYKDFKFYQRTNSKICMTIFPGSLGEQITESATITSNSILPGGKNNPSEMLSSDS